VTTHGVVAGRILTAVSVVQGTLVNICSIGTSGGNKTKIARPRPRPVKQQQEYMTEKTFLLQHACLLSKNNLVQKNKKVMTSNVLIARKNTGAY